MQTSATSHAFENVFEINHPLAKHYLSQLRDKTTKPEQFRILTKKIALILAIEATRHIPLKNVEIDTPLEKTTCQIVRDDVVIVPILRAGLGMIESIIELFPNVHVGYVGVQRDEKTALPIHYYSNIPNIKNRTVLVTDPMLATGGSASHVLSLLQNETPSSVSLLNIVSTPEGIARIRKDHPNVSIYTASIDRELNEKKYILPGLGDFGDRLYGT